MGLSVYSTRPVSAVIQARHLWGGGGRGVREDRTTPPPTL